MTEKYFHICTLDIKVITFHIPHLNVFRSMFRGHTVPPQSIHSHARFLLILHMLPESNEEEWIKELLLTFFQHLSSQIRSLGKCVVQVSIIRNMTRVSSLKVGINSGMDLRAINIYFIYRYSQCNHLKKRTRVQGGVLAKLKVCKTSRSDLPVIHPCSCCTNVQVVYKLRVSTHNCGFPREGKELLNETRETGTHVKVASCRSGTSTACLHLQRHVSCRSRPERKYPGVMFRFRLQTSASLENDPRSRCQREGGGGGVFSVWSHRWDRSIEFLNLFASPNNSSITAWDAAKEETPDWRPF